jgi:hypothetical protein
MDCPFVSSSRSFWRSDGRIVLAIFLSIFILF